VLRDFAALEMSGAACGRNGAAAPPHPRRLASSAASL